MTKGSMMQHTCYVAFHPEAILSSLQMGTSALPVDFPAFLASLHSVVGLPFFLALYFLVGCNLES